ncbi:MAG: MFS transporter [Dehalococcoidia bacterium]|jgi:MFS family permease|nr:MFS transporter [Dehalococcoidia bacterium]
MKQKPSDAPGKPLFYGYVVVAAAFLSMAVSSGAIFSFSVFFAPLQEEFGWTRAITSSAFSLNMFVQGMLGIVVGKLNDRFGPRLILTLSGAILGIGFILVSTIDAIWQLYLLYGVVIGIGVSGGPVPLMSTVARWFRARRGLMTGIVMAGVGLGTMIVPPLADWLIRTFTWRTSFVAVGVLLLVAIPLTAQFLRRDPAGMGLQPLGGREITNGRQLPASPGVPFSDAIRTRQLWLIVAAFGGFGFTIQSVMVHVVIHATGLGLTASTAAALMTAIGALGVVGRVGIGGLADRYGSKRLLVSQYALLALSLIWLGFARDTWSIFACAFVFGFSFGGIVPLNSHIVAELFGLRAHGAVLGATGISIGIGGSIGPVFTGFCYDVLASYTVPFVVCGIVTAVAALLMCLVKPLRPQTGS